MYWATESAGRLGSFIIIMVASVMLGLTAKSIGARFLTTLKSIVVLVTLLTALAYVNENLLKRTLRISRPSHTYIITQSKSKAAIDSLYGLTTHLRRAYFKNLIDHDTVDFKNIDPRILNHWIDESGYSFPSGHSFSAFLLATILSFSIYRYQGQRITVWSFIPLLWAAIAAFSRVAVGAHTALDVSAGAAIGLIISHVLLAIPFTRRLLLPANERFADKET